MTKHLAILFSGWRALAVSAGSLFCACLAAGADAPSTGASPTSFSYFRVIGDSNIFNPYRVGRTAERPPPPVVETIALVGTMQYAKGLFAFFDSPDGAYRRALHEGDAIADFKVTRISAGAVELERDSKKFPLAVGQQLRRPEGGDWSVTAAEPAAPQAAPAETESSEAPAIPADASDILKRLMEQRQKQLRQ